jgi:Protein of unknown function (DUF3089)
MFLAGLAAAFVLAFAGSASAKTVWLCRPGLANNPCVTSLATTDFSPTGKKLGVDHIKAVRRPQFDCFYVYPTVSSQSTPNANLAIEPVERSIALYQAARYGQYCKVYAPMYRQATLSGIISSQAATAISTGYADVLAAWKEYLKRFNHRRGFVLIGHSQGSFQLIRLIREQIDKKPAVRRRLISAVLLGGNVKVKKGKEVGGDFQHVPGCRSDTQIGCVIAWSTFDQPPPTNSLFGRTSTAGEQVLCTNPAALGGGSGSLDPIEPTTPFAPGSAIAALITLLHLPLPAASTQWISIPGAYRAHCSSADGASVLEIVPHGGAPVPSPSPDPTWGLHLIDSNVALGNVLDIVSTQARAYAARG